MTHRWGCVAQRRIPTYDQLRYRVDLVLLSRSLTVDERYRGAAGARSARGAAPQAPLTPPGLPWIGRLMAMAAKNR